MAIIQEVKDGELVNSAKSSTGTTTSTSSSSNSYDKEMFLQLLVAEMQYQDPLEPTSNTEYVAELASFSQIEAIQAVQDQMSTIEANSLVGKYVIVNDNDNLISGKVDYVTTEDDEMYLYINDKKYSADSLETVCDEEYYEAVVASQTFTSMVSSLPTIYSLTTSDADKLTTAREYLNSLTDYQKQFVSSDDVSALEKLEEQMKKLTGSDE